MGVAGNPGGAGTAAAPERPVSHSPEEKRAALQSVLDSETFARCDQLRNFLRYVTEMAVEGRSREVTEYLIAVEALGRPPGFSPADDSSVRSRAHELRRKLQKHYETEDPEAALRIELPKGSYAPRFVSGHVGTSAEPAPVFVPAIAAPEMPLPARPPAFPRGWLLAIGIAIGLAAAFAWGQWHEAPAARANAAITEAWGPLLGQSSNVLVCVASTMHLVVRPYMSVVAEGLPKYPAPPELYSMYRQHRPLPPGTQLDMHPVDNSVQMGHLGAVLTLSGMFQSRGLAFQTLPERSAPVSAMRGRNVILIGDPQNSSAAAELLDKAPLMIDYDAGVDDLVVRDRRSGGKTYQPKRGPDKRYSDVYGLITVMPSPGAKNNQRMVILSGITSVGSQGAAEFFASARDLQELRKRFTDQGLRGLPPAYQVLVRCKSNDTLLVTAVYEAHAVMPN